MAIAGVVILNEHWVGAAPRRTYEFDVEATITPPLPGDQPFEQIARVRKNGGVIVGPTKQMNGPYPVSKYSVHFTLYEGSDVDAGDVLQAEATASWKRIIYEGPSYSQQVPI